MPSIHFQSAAIVAAAMVLASTPFAVAQVRVNPGLGGGYNPPVAVAPPTVSTGTALSLPTNNLNLNSGVTLGGTPGVPEPERREIERAQVASPPPSEAQPAPDGGGSDCTCPDGQVADVEGWCWRSAPDSGAWEREEACQN